MQKEASGTRSRCLLASLIDFGVFYSTAIERILGGAPLDIYSFVAYPPGSSLALPVTNPPLYFFFLAPWYALGRLAGISDFHNSSGFSLGQAWMLLATLPFDLLLCHETLRCVEDHGGRLPEPRRWILYLCLLFTPLLWLSSVRFGHNEAMMILRAGGLAWRERHARRGLRGAGAFPEDDGGGSGADLFRLGAGPLSFHGNYRRRRSPFLPPLSPAPPRADPHAGG